MEKYKHLIVLSNKKQEKNKKKFDSYGEALDNYMIKESIAPTELAKKIKKKSVKLSSVQSMLSKWRKGDPIGYDYQNKINHVLDINIKRNGNGKWQVSHANGRKDAQVADDELNYSALELAQEERRRLGIAELPDTELGRAAQDALIEASNSFVKLRRLILLIEKEKNQSD